MKTVVVGAGIIGALTAYRLVRAGIDVTVIDAAQPASGASGASFGWINASFYLNENHHLLRAAAIQAHHRLARDLSSAAVQWQGCLCWEEQGEAFDARYEALVRLGYSVREVLQDEFNRLEPAVLAPAKALLFEDEGAADLVQLSRDALAAAQSAGARLITGIAVQAVETLAGRVAGVRWSGGIIPADQVVLAAGNGTRVLAESVDVHLPMLSRPGLILRSEPLAPMLAHILVTPDQELRQLPDGRLLAPVAASHQSDSTEEITENPAALADEAALRLKDLINCELHWEDIALAWRPVPADGLPVIGFCGPEGVYIATMHSGATLAPLAAEIAAAEITGPGVSNETAVQLAPCRPGRFRG